jgi:hypothetical protein
MWNEHSNILPNHRFLQILSRYDLFKEIKGYALLDYHLKIFN